ncbi:hypothetical protein BD413DRAFT_611881 [Trametes elegans]|nr:hypothetical protein BD413DRAFT_611881 [Trametes elegans]
MAGLNDPIAELESSAIPTTQCLVYLHTLLRLPIPDSRTFNPMAYLIGQGLRPENHAKCYVPDMCIPTHPNAAYPSGERKPLRPVGPGFPYDNCFQWNGGDMQLDSRIINDKRSYPQTSLSILH